MNCIGGLIAIVQGGALRATPAARIHARVALGQIPINRIGWYDGQAVLPRQTVFARIRRQPRQCPRVA